MRLIAGPGSYIWSQPPGTEPNQRFLTPKGQGSIRHGHAAGSAEGVDSEKSKVCRQTPVSIRAASRFSELEVQRGRCSAQNAEECERSKPVASTLG